MAYADSNQKIPIGLELTSWLYAEGWQRAALGAIEPTVVEFCTLKSSKH
jgi:hypothetical protein